MSLQKVKLEFVSIANVFGHAMEFSGDGSRSDPVTGFKARFGLTVNAATLNDPNESRFTVQMNFEAFDASVEGEDSPFFKIEVVGHFLAKDTHKLDAWINDAEGAYSLGAMIFPYLRNLSKPMLEGLGASQVDFPWSSPEITKIDQSTPKRKRSSKKQS